MTNPAIATLFLSHPNSQDRFVHDLRLKLETHGYRVVEDATAFLAGDNLSDAVKQGIDAADHLIVVITPDAARSEWVRRELRYAQSGARDRDGYRIIPPATPRRRA